MERCTLKAGWEDGSFVGRGSAVCSGAQRGRRGPAVLRRAREACGGQRPSPRPESHVGPAQAPGARAEAISSREETQGETKTPWWAWPEVTQASAVGTGTDGNLGRSCG